MQQQQNLKVASIKTITPVLPFKYYEMKQAFSHLNNNNNNNDVNFSSNTNLNQFGQFESNEKPVITNSMISRALALTPKFYATIDPANLNINSKINPNSLKVITTPQQTLVGHLVNKNFIRIAKNDIKNTNEFKITEIIPKESDQLKMEQTHSHSYNVIEPRKGIFIQDEDEDGEDFTDEHEKKMDEYQLTNSSEFEDLNNQYFNDLTEQSPGSSSSFLTFSNNSSSGLSTPRNSQDETNNINTNNINNNNIDPSYNSSSKNSSMEITDDMISTQYQDKTNLNNNNLVKKLQFTKSQLISYQIRAASAAFADILPCNGNKKRNVAYASFNENEKRTFHILSERQRRHDLKKLFENLRNNIPDLEQKQKASKLNILKTAVEHLAQIAHTNERLQRTFQRETLKQKQLMQYLRSLETDTFLDLYSNNNALEPNDNNNNSCTGIM